MNKARNNLRSPIAVVNDWLAQPVGLLTQIALGAAIIAGSWWLVADELTTYRLSGDDFVYLAGARNPSTLVQNLTTPHNAHVVPLFRIWVYVLKSIAGRLDRLALVFAMGSFLAELLLMLGLGHFVAHETGKSVLGLGAMALLGLSTVLEPSVSWFCASQALWSGLCVVLMLEALRRARRKGSQGWLAAAFLLALAAPWFWSGGYAAGPVGTVYRWFSVDRHLIRGRHPRYSSIVPLAATVLAAGLAVGWAGGTAGGGGGGGRDRLFTSLNWHSPVVGIFYACQSFAESLLLGNLGLDAETTAAQGIVFVILFIFVWLSSKRFRPFPTPLEAAGGTLILLTLGMAYTLRSNERFEILRGLGWYLAMPQVGLVLFISGWGAERGLGDSPTLRRDIAAVAVLCLVMFILHTPRSHHFVIADVPSLTKSEERFFSSDAHRLERARALALERSERQRMFLSRVDAGISIARRLGMGREEYRLIFGRIRGPGFPPQVPELDTAALVDLPEHGRTPSKAEILSSFGSARFQPVEPFRPPWIAKDEAWPPPSKRIVRPD